MHLTHCLQSFLVKFIFLMTLLSCCFQPNAKEISTASDIWCPYICQDSQQPGYIVEMINEILQAKKLNTKNETMPLARAIKYLQNGDIDIVLGLTQQHIDHHHLISSNLAVGNSTNDFFVNKKNSWRFSTIEQLEIYAKTGHKIGIIKGYFYGTELNELIAKQPDLFSYAHGDSPLQQLLSRLKSGRINILLDSKNTVLHEIKKLNTAGITYAGTQGMESKLYIALSKAIEPELLALIDQGISDYRQSGKLDKLLAKYGINDWQ